MQPTPLVPVALTLCLAAAPSATAQTDYYNTESHHPLLVEDATPLERHALELRPAPLTLERRDDGTYIWTLTPELGYGILPPTHVEIGAALAWSDPGAVGTSGSLAGVDVGVMHQLPLERRRNPALAVGLNLAAPLGGLAHDDWFTSLGGMATRTLSFARLHLNGEYTVGPARQASGIRHASRWSTGMAVDRAFVLGSALLAAEVVVTKPMGRQAGDVHPVAHDQFYLPAEHNWMFRARYAGADRMFNAFDYGHAILYETLYARPSAPASRLEVDEYDRITTEILAAPPRLPLEEGAIEIAYARLVPEVKAMFEWAHVLHRQLYDVWADERIADAEKDTRVAELLRYYRSLSDIAFSTVPKRMPMGPAVTPLFAARYPEAAIIFDNLHAMHDVVSDILASPVVPRNGKRRAILEAAARYRPDEPFAMSIEEWREMTRAVGAHNLGGPATGFTAELPTPTVPIGATHMDAMGHEHPAPSTTPRHDH
jgi:hypothetical protein